MTPTSGIPGAAVRRATLACGAVLILLGAVSVVEALRMRDDWQGAKLMPASLGIVLMVLGIAHVVTSLGDPPAWPDAPARRRVAFMFGVLVLYVAALPWLGFLPTTSLFVLVLVRSFGAFSWPIALVLTVTIAIATHVVFKHWLGMPLPSGPFGV